MPWIPDVVPQTTIRSVWGNTVRNQVVQVFATKTERETTAVPQEGMVCWVTETQSEYVWHNAAWWPLSTWRLGYTPRVWMTDGTTWQACSITQVVNACYTRRLSEVTVNLHVQFTAESFNVGWLIVVSLPFAPLLGGVLGNGIAGPSAGGAGMLGGTWGWYKSAAQPAGNPTALLTDVRGGLYAGVSGMAAAQAAQAILSYHTDNSNDVSPWG